MVVDLSGVKNETDSYALPAAAILVAGCAASTGILPIGPNTYMVSETLAPVRVDGGTEAQQIALTEASAFRQKQNRVIVRTILGQAGNLNNPYGQTGDAVTLHCLPPDDPVVAKSQLERAPDLVLERRDR